MENIKLEKEPISKKGIILGISFILIYIVFSAIPGFYYDCRKSYYISLIVANIILIIISIFFFKSRLRRDVKALKDNFKKYTEFIIKQQCIMFVIYLAVSVISFALSYFLFGSVDSSINQQEIESLPMFVIIFLAIIYGPIVEELLFRGSIRRFIKNDILFIIISGLVFGLLHTLLESTLLEALIKGIPYIFAGFYFAYLYVKTENITISVISHFIHNFIALLAIILLNI